MELYSECLDPVRFKVLTARSSSLPALLPHERVKVLFWRPIKSGSVCAKGSSGIFGPGAWALTRFGPRGSRDGFAGGFVRYSRTISTLT